ncbi:MAG: O-antigen ligase family protein [Coriobacteriia bacterium]|nr:O-antigen ligase family protein [Coriobacteriia bacterium]
MVGAALGTAIALLSNMGGLPVVIGVFGGGIAVIASILAIPVALSRASSLRGRLRWYHTAWIVLFLSGLTWRVRDVSAIYSEPVDTAALVRIGLVAIVGLIAVLSTFRSGSRLIDSLTKGAVGILAAYAVFGVVSTLWSVFPAWSLYKSTEYLVDVAVAALILTELRDVRDTKAFADITWLMLGALVGSVWLGVLLEPELALRTGIGVLGYQLQGVWPAVSQNGVGELGAILGIVALSRLVSFEKGRGFYALVLGVGVVTMLAAQSRSPILGFALASLVVLQSLGKMSGLTFGALAAATAALSPLGTWIEAFLRRGQSLAEIASLSGRTTIYWVRAAEVFVAHAAVGVGAYSGGRFVVIPLIGNVGGEQIGSSVDNAFIEVAISLGVMGLALLVWTLMLVGSRLLRVGRKVRGFGVAEVLRAEALGVFILLVVRAAFSSGPVIWHPATSFLTVVVVCEMLWRVFGQPPGAEEVAA